MRKAVLAALVLFSAVTLFADCTQPNLMISGIQGDMASPCTGAVAFTTASYTPPSTTSSTSGAGAGKPTPGTLNVVKVFDSSSPNLMLDCAQGKHLQTVTLTYPNGQTPVKVTFGDVTVTTVTENVNPTNESVEFKYTKIQLQSGNTTVTGLVTGGARASSMTAAVIGSDGKSHPVSHASITVRPGGTTFNSVQLAPTAPGIATARAGIVRATPGSEGPEESIHFNYGKLVIVYNQQKKEGFDFSGGTLLNGNLRVSRASYTGPTTVAIHPQ